MFKKATDPKAKVDLITVDMRVAVSTVLCCRDGNGVQM